VNTEFKPYDVLGVKPGISTQELKAVYRDLAKVWHPDRFGHDPRLQQKAQEKLKEINEAYEQIISGAASKPKVEQRNYERSSSGYEYQAKVAYEYQAQPAKSKANGQPIRWTWLVVPLVLFFLVFYITRNSLLRQPAPQVVRASPQLDQATSDQPDRVAENSANKKTVTKTNPESQVEPQANQVSTEAVTSPVRAVATVTVLIDGSTGLLARPECPTKSRMTYPAGSEPHEYCNAHRPVEAASSESKVKSLAKKVISPGKWAGSGGDKDKTGSEGRQND
jgi:hypothetical protein